MLIHLWSLVFFFHSLICCVTNITLYKSSGLTPNLPMTSLFTHPWPAVVNFISSGLTYIWLRPVVLQTSLSKNGVADIWFFMTASLTENKMGTFGPLGQRSATEAKNSASMVQSHIFWFNKSYPQQGKLTASTTCAIITNRCRERTKQQVVFIRYATDQICCSRNKCLGFVTDLKHRTSETFLSG